MPAKASAKRIPAKGRKADAQFIEPMQCRPVTKLPEGDEWLHELKLDGYRCVVVKNGSEIKLVSRNGKPLNSRFPQLVADLAGLPAERAVLDGEVVMLDEQGRPSFQVLQNSATASGLVYFYAFDLLHLEGEALLKTPLEQRRGLLAPLMAGVGDPVRFSAELPGTAEQITAAVTQLGLEGVVAKRRNSLYEPGERSGAWVKFRTNNAQEFVIGGYIPGAQTFDALLIGYYSGNHLLYAAKVLNGFVPRDKAAVGPQLKRLNRTSCPFTNLPEPKGGRWGESLTAEKMKECVWVEPELVCHVSFIEWTSTSHLRHCSFAGMRQWKAAKDVVRET